MRDIRWRSVLWLPLVGLLASGAAVEQAGRSLVAQDGARPRSAFDDQRPSDRESLDYVEKVLDAVGRGDARRLNQLIDWDAVLDRALDGFDEGQASDGFRQGFLETVQGENGFTNSVVDAVKQGGSLTFLRMIEREDRDHALFRLVLPDGGFNYIEFVIRKDRIGRIIAHDVYPYTSGEFTSQTLRRAYLPLASDAPELRARLSGDESLYLTHADDVSRFAELVAGGEARDALAVYDALPEELQRDKNCLMLRLRAAQQISDLEYSAALRQVRLHYPDDPSSDLLSIDAYLLAENYDEALACIDRLDRRVGGDGYLNVPRSMVMLLQRDFVRARELAEVASQDPISSLQGFWTLVRISLTAEDYAETLRLLMAMDRQFELHWGDLTQLPEYRGFVSSPQFETWLEYLGG